MRGFRERRALFVIGLNWLSLSLITPLGNRLVKSPKSFLHWAITLLISDTELRPINPHHPE